MHAPLGGRRRVAPRPRAHCPRVGDAARRVRGVGRRRPAVEAKIEQLQREAAIRAATTAAPPPPLPPLAAYGGGGSGVGGGIGVASPVVAAQLAARSRPRRAAGGDGRLESSLHAMRRQRMGGAGQGLRGRRSQRLAAGRRPPAAQRQLGAAIRAAARHARARGGRVRARDTLARAAPRGCASARDAGGAGASQGGAGGRPAAHGGDRRRRHRAWMKEQKRQLVEARAARDLRSRPAPSARCRRRSPSRARRHAQRGSSSSGTLRRGSPGRRGASYSCTPSTTACGPSRPSRRSAGRRRARRELAHA